MLLIPSPYNDLVVVPAFYLARVEVEQVFRIGEFSHLVSLMKIFFVDDDHLLPLLHQILQLTPSKRTEHVPTLE